MLCKAHHADIREQIDILREQGKTVDVTRIARRMYRDLHPDENVITPHKGGRTEIVSTARVTPETKEKLQTILDRRGMSYADWLTEMVEREVTK